jgi:hypothetical protein
LLLAWWTAHHTCSCACLCSDPHVLKNLEVFLFRFVRCTKWASRLSPPMSSLMKTARRSA